MNPPDVVLEFGLGHTRGLEIELIEDRVVGLRHDGGRADRTAWPERDTEADHAAEAVGAQQRCMPRHRRAPVVTGDDRLLGTQGVEQTDHVADQMKERVLVDRLGAIGPAVAAHVGATAWNPASASAGSWCRQEYQDLGKPWHSTTNGPVPCSAKCMRMPFVSMVRCRGSVMGSISFR